jgi:hypothetical protein
MVIPPTSRDLVEQDCTHVFRVFSPGFQNVEFKNPKAFIENILGLLGLKWGWGNRVVVPPEYPLDYQVGRILGEKPSMFRWIELDSITKATDVKKS